MTTPIRTFLAPSFRSISHVASPRSNIICRATFASSSKVRLDASNPVSAGQRTTLLEETLRSDVPEQAEPSSSSSSSSTSSTPSSSSASSASSAPAPFTPAFSFTNSSGDTTPPGLFLKSDPNDLTSPSLNLGSAARRFVEFDGDPKKGLMRYHPIEPLTIPIPIKRGNLLEPSGAPIMRDAPNRAGRITHTLTIKCTRNNVHLSFVDKTGCLFGTITAGSGKVFKKSNRSTYEAAHQAALKMFEKILEYSREYQVQLCVAFNGLQGQGREAIASAIQGPEGSEFARLIVRVEDRTPILMGGPRPRGKRNG